MKFRNDIIRCLILCILVMAVIVSVATGVQQTQKQAGLPSLSSKAQVDIPVGNTVFQQLGTYFQEHRWQIICFAVFLLAQTAVILGLLINRARRKETEQSLLESEAKFRRLVENVPDVIWTSDSAGNTVYISENVRDIFGYSQEEVYENPHQWLGRIHPDDIDRVMQAYALLFQTGARFDTEYRIRHKHGHWIWLHDRSTSFYEKDCIPYADGLFTDITDRKRAEEEFSQIFSMSLDLLCIADMNSATFLRVNPRFTEVLGYSEKELLEKSFLDFIHPEDVEATRTVIELKLQLGTKVINFDNRYRCKDGSYRWLSWAAHPNPEKGITYSVARDITEWKQNQEALKKSKELLDATGRMARVGGWELDADTMAVTWTEETCRIHEIPPGYKPTLQEAINFFHPEDRENLQHEIQRSLEYGESYDLEIRLITAQGKHLWTRTICQPEIIDGKTVKLKGTFQDITERKEIELAFRKNEEKLLSAQEIARLGYWEWDLVTDQLSWSDEMYRIYGIAPGAPVAPDDMSGRVHADDREYHQKLMDDLLNEKTVPSFSYRIIRPDGSVRYIYGMKMLEFDDHGDPSIIKGTLQDVTETKTVEMAYRESEDRLKKAQFETFNLRLEMAHLNRIMTMNELAVSFAHEINQPLGAIVNNASVAKIMNSRSDEGREDLNEILDDIAGDAQRAGQIIYKIRGIMKKGDAVYTSVNVNQLLDDVISLYQNSFNLDHVSVVIVKDPNLVPVKGDRVRLQQVLINLITNAMDAMDNSSKKNLKFKTFQSEGMVNVCVSDSGSGIGQYYFDQIFNPFYTTKNKGVGIGLRLCKSIIEEHGGRIWAENNHNAGTTFYFTLNVFSEEHTHECT